MRNSGEFEITEFEIADSEMTENIRVNPREFDLSSK